MRSTLRQVIPSMFHRRLLLLLVAMVVCVGGISAQLLRLTVVEGSERLSEAERVLSSSRPLPTVRGRIVDAEGRAVAIDAPSEDIAVDYEVISGAWVDEQAIAEARREQGYEWVLLSQDDRELLIRKARAPYERKLERLWKAVCRYGEIDRAELERRRSAIINSVQRIRAAVWQRQLERRRARTEGPIDFADIAIEVAEQHQAHVLIPAASDEAAIFFRKNREHLPGVKVIASKRRVYPLAALSVRVDFESFPREMREQLGDRGEAVVEVEALGDPVVGAMRNVWAEDVDEEDGGRPYRRSDGTIDRAGYRPGDRRGMRGVEYAEEWTLRGLRGLEVYHRDSGVTDVKPPVPGDDVRLTLDMHLQARVRALLDPFEVGLMRVQPWHWHERQEPPLTIGTPLNGAAVVLEVDTGRILAMVSSPTRDPDAEAEGEAEERAEAETWPTEHDLPRLNRPLTPRPPGSTVKPIVYALAAAAGEVGIDQTFNCEGQFPGKRVGFRCWGWRPEQGLYIRHNDVGPVEAIAQSCNIFHYYCGRALGAHALVDGFRAFGFGEDPGIGIGRRAEVSGYLPSHAQLEAMPRVNYHNTAMFMGIGQVGILASPLQVAAAHAALARGGYYLSPVLIDHRQGDQAARDLQIPAPVLRHAQEGMYESANDPQLGTGHHLRDGEPIINLEGVIVRSKTGTAQAPIQFEDVNENGRYDEQHDRLIREGTHAWYVAHVQKPGEDRAAYIVVVLVEYGGSGGRVAGPIVNQILHALRAEGYL